MRLNPQYHSCRSCCEIWAMLHPGAQPESACEVFHPILQRADGGRDCQNCTTTSTAPWAPNFEERWMWKADKTWWGCNAIYGVYKWHYGIQRIHRCWATTQYAVKKLGLFGDLFEGWNPNKGDWVILDFVTFWQWFWPNGCNGPRNLAMKVLPRAESFVRTQPGALARRNLSTILLLKMRLPNEDRHAIIQEIVSRSWQDEGLDFALFSKHLFFLISSSGTRCAFAAKCSTSASNRTRQVYSRKSKMTVSFNSFCVKLTRSGVALPEVFKDQLEEFWAWTYQGIFTRWVFCWDWLNDWSLKLWARLNFSVCCPAWMKTRCWACTMLCRLPVRIAQVWSTKNLFLGLPNASKKMAVWWRCGNSCWPIARATLMTAPKLQRSCSQHLLID